MAYFYIPPGNPEKRHSTTIYFNKGEVCNKCGRQSLVIVKNSEGKQVYNCCKHPFTPRLNNQTSK